MIHFPVAVYEAMTALLNKIYLYMDDFSILTKKLLSHEYSIYGLYT